MQPIQPWRYGYRGNHCAADRETEYCDERTALLDFDFFHDFFMLIFQQKQSSDVGVTDKLSKLSVRDDHREADTETTQSDHPASKKTKSSSRSRRRRKARRGDGAENGGAIASCEFVQGGGGKIHSSAGQDWFSIDAINNHTGTFDSRLSATSSGDKERRDSMDRRKTATTSAVEGSSKFDIH